MNLFLLLVLATQAPNLQVSVKALEGETRCTITAEQVNPRAVFGALMREARPLPGVRSLVVVGADNIPTAPLLDLTITNRPFGEALGILMGCVGLRLEQQAGTLTLVPEYEDASSHRELLERSRRNLVSTFAAFPSTEVSPLILQAMARVEDKLGLNEAAEAHLRQLAQDFPTSELVPSALAHAGRLLQQAGQWGEAKQVLSQLCNLPYAHDFYPNGLLELARCHAQLSEGRQGIRILDALNAIWPLEEATASPSEQAERHFVHAACLYEAGDAGRALVLLDKCNELGHRGDLDPQVLPLRARALAAVGRPADASVAWLARSRTVKSKELQSSALVEAARLALVADDQLALDLIYARGVELGVEQALEGFRFQARASLGLDTDGMKPDSPAGLLLLGKVHLDAGRYEQALTSLLALKGHREELSESDNLKLNILLGRASHEVRGVDSAVAEMREGLSLLPRRGDRTQIYLYAAELYESAGRYEDAIAAYEGQL
jgi:tetratricopeptide (TPR) repeat protein